MVDLREHAMTDRPPRAFGVEESELGGAPGVAVHGEADVSAVPALVEALDAAIRDSAGAFVIDLCDVEFLDSSGLSALMRARALLGREERALALVCPRGPVRPVQPDPACGAALGSHCEDPTGGRLCIGGEHDLPAVR